MSARERFLANYDVSRETSLLFDSYAAVLTEWQMRINLVGPATIATVWERHFADSAQLLPLAVGRTTWLDIGAGAGFPGLVIALLDPCANITLVESVAKKCRFLSAVASLLGIQDRVMIENRRIETLPRQKFDVVTARALAGLDQLFDWALPFSGSGTTWLLPKGARIEAELLHARVRFAFNYNLVPSRTDATGRIVVANGVTRR